MASQGNEEFPAGESYDSAAEIMNKRLHNVQQQSAGKLKAMQDVHNAAVRKKNELNA